MLGRYIFMPALKSLKSLRSLKTLKPALCFPAPSLRSTKNGCEFRSRYRRSGLTPIISPERRNAALPAAVCPDLSGMYRHRN